MKKLINNWILSKAIKQLGKDVVKYKSTLHNHFREDGIKTRGRFNIMLTLLLIIQSKYDRFLGIKNIDIDENTEVIKIKISLNKPSRLTLYKEEIEKELTETIKKDTRLELIYTNKFFGLDYYNVI